MESFITEYADYVAVAVGFVIFFDRLAKITPTNSDNKIVEYAYKVFAILGLKVKDNEGK